MPARTATVAVAVAVAVVSAVSCLASGVSVSSSQWSYAQLEMFWAPVQCDGSGRSVGCSQSCVDTGSRFTIHGFWPNYASGGYPSYCTEAKFSASNVSSIMDELNSDWPSLSDGSNEAFWAHEYEKHGTCATDVFPTEFDFFSGTLALYKKYESVLGDSIAGFVGGKAYADDIFDAIQNATGFKPQLSCYDSKLSLVALCFGDGDLAIQDCPYQSSGCDDSVSVPSMCRD